MILASIIGFTYPFAVYFGLQRFSPFSIALCLLSFIGFRIVIKWHETKQKIELVALCVTLIVVGLLTFFDQVLALKSYPVAISLSLAAVFAYSVVNPPSIIERFARLLEPNLNAKGVRYTRNVTIVWIVFLICNAGVSLLTAFYGSLEFWTFYNGFLSYMCVGALMAGEFIVRQFVKKHHVDINQ
jgi:uncharacterized membrane protein